MQTQPTPISQIVSPNATPGPANRSLPPAADGDFQRALDRQIEQRQLSTNAAQTQAAAPAPRNLPPQQAPQPAQAAQPQQAQQSQAPQPAGKAPAADAAPAEQAAQPATDAATQTRDAATQTKDGAETETVAASVATSALPPEDPAAAMLALVGSIKLAMQQPAAASKSVAETPGSALTGKSEGKAVTAAQLLASGKVAVDAGPGVSKGAAPAGD